jgi:hypothetical protein
MRRSNKDSRDKGQAFQDIQGDVYEYLLSEIAQAGKNGQFRTPRHIIKLMAELVQPQLGPDYNTLGASINKITMKTFGKRETIGGFAEQKLNALKDRFEALRETGTDAEKNALVDEIELELGDSVEKMLLIKTILDSMEGIDG